MKNIAIITARSGSKGLPGKNILELAGKPLLAHSVIAGIESGLFDEVMVSTDSMEYAEIAKAYGAEVPFLRSNANSTDQASTVDTILEVLSEYEKRGREFDTFCLLQPTSPLRTAKHIKEAYDLYFDRNAKSIVSVCEAEHSPLYCNHLPKDNSLEGFLSNSVNNSRRQDLGKFYRLNGAIYISDVENYRETRSLYGPKSYAYIMEKSDSVDIDDAYDFQIAEVLMQQK